MTARLTKQQLEDAEARIRMMEATEVIAELGAVFQLNPDCITPQSVKAAVLELVNRPQRGRDFVKEANLLLAAKDEEIRRLKILVQSPLGSGQETSHGYRPTENPTTIRIE